MELNELYQLFSIFLYIGVFTEGFFWGTQEYLEHEKSHWAEKTLVPGLPCCDCCQQSQGQARRGQGSSDTGREKK